MSTPLFNQQPTNGTGIAPILGASLAAYSNATPMTDLTAVDGEPVLIEEIAYCAEKLSTLDGQLLLAIVDNAGNRRLIGSYDIPAAVDGTHLASGRIKVDFVKAAGFKLVAAHDVTIAGPAYTNLHVVPVGGVVR